MEAGNGLAATFAELHTLADSIAQEVEFGSTYYRVPLNIDLVNFRGVNGELTLNTFTGDDSTDNKHFARARSAFRDNRAGKNLDPFLVAFLDSRVHVYGVADLEGIHVFLEKRAFNGLKNLLAHDLRTLPVYKVLKRKGPISLPKLRFMERANHRKCHVYGSGKLGFLGRNRWVALSKTC